MVYHLHCSSIIFILKICLKPIVSVLTLICDVIEKCLYLFVKKQVQYFSLFSYSSVEISVCLYCAFYSLRNCIFLIYVVRGLTTQYIKVRILLKLIQQIPNFTLTYKCCDEITINPNWRRFTIFFKYTFMPSINRSTKFGNTWTILTLTRYMVNAY